MQMNDFENFKLKKSLDKLILFRFRFMNDKIIIILENNNF